MTAATLIEQARADGLELLTNGDRLKVRGPADVVERWKPRIVASKSEIMATLSAPDTELSTETEPEQLRCCATCIHRPPRHLDFDPAPCCNPVDAGLSEREGVIRYHPDNGATCRAWLARVETVSTLSPTAAWLARPDVTKQSWRDAS
jgi:hypothetical protein